MGKWHLSVFASMLWDLQIHSWYILGTLFLLAKVQNKTFCLHLTFFLVFKDLSFLVSTKLEKSAHVNVTQTPHLMLMKVFKSMFGTLKRSERSTKKLFNTSCTHSEVVASLTLKLTLNDWIIVFFENPKYQKFKNFYIFYFNHRSQIQTLRLTMWNSLSEKMSLGLNNKSSKFYDDLFYNHGNNRNMI